MFSTFAIKSINISVGNLFFRFAHNFPASMNIKNLS